MSDTIIKEADNVASWVTIVIVIVFFILFILMRVLCGRVLRDIAIKKGYREKYWWWLGFLFNIFFGILVLFIVSHIKERNCCPANPLQSNITSDCFYESCYKADNSIPTIKLTNDFNKDSSNITGVDENKETKKYIESKLRQVSWLQQCLNQRKNLIYDIAVFLLDYQQDFFMNQGSCHPLLQKDIAMLLGVHESTISRAIKDKYIYCDKGFILLSDLIPKGTEDNSVDSIKETIKEVIDIEDKNKPLSDQKITNLLKDKGIEISRRTVAKYRSELNIPDASGRKHVKK